MAKTEGSTSFACSVDVSGTFTDRVLVDETRAVTTAKALSTDVVVDEFFDSIDIKIGSEL